MTHIQSMVICILVTNVFIFFISRYPICIIAICYEGKREGAFICGSNRYGRCDHDCHQSQRYKLFHKMYLLRFFFRSFSLCYLLSCGILLMILVNYIAYGDGSPPAKFTRIIFVYPSLSDHWYHLLVLEFLNLFWSAFSFFVRFVFGFIIADFSVLFFNWHELWLWWHKLLKVSKIEQSNASA